jgi:hypothetical protein
MKLFISWSGQVSKDIAEIFRTWIPGVIQAAKPYYSPSDIEKGTRRSSEISKELENSKFGIICLTKDNLEAPWIMFEAGALSKNIDRSKVCPFLFGVEPADVQGPLVQFQAAKFEKAEVKKLMKSVNSELSDQALSADVFESVFDMWWPKLEERIAECLKTHATAKSKHGAARSEKDMLEELLALTRSLSQTSTRGTISPQAVADLILAFRSLLSRIIQEGAQANYNTEIMAFEKPLGHLARRSNAIGLESDVAKEFERFKAAVDDENLPF